MMKNYILAVCATALFTACNNTGEQNKTTDTAVTAHAHADTSIGDPMSTMHDAMNRMMSEMNSAPLNGNPDHDFALLMKIHHQSAIDMAKVVAANTKDTMIKAHAQRTVDEQQKEVNFFDQYLSKDHPAGNSDYGKKALNAMSHMSGDMHSDSLEIMYAKMMIPHHRSAVTMAEDYLKVGKDAELLKIARSIIQTQPKEIKEYESWIK